MARLYSNENFPMQAVEELQRVLLTLNRRHFIRLHQHKKSHAGILACTFDPDFIIFAARIDKALQSKSDLSGKVIRINRLEK